MEKNIKKKIVLAFSGGLDTSFCVPYLSEKGYEVITVTVDTGGFTMEELKKIAQKSKKLGAIKHYLVDGKKIMYEKIISYIIKTNGLYEKSYPNLCADRYIIAEEAIKIAKKENATAIAHGSTAMGNDQVRFDLALMTLAPKIEIITPIRETGGNRNEEQKYLEKRGFLVSNSQKEYSINQNILGIVYSGGSISKVLEGDESIFHWTKLKQSKKTYVKITFKNGQPIALNNKKLDGAEILQFLNKIVGEYGVGKEYYTGNCIIGIKGRIAFESPGILALIKAHIALEQVVLTKPQEVVGNYVSEYFTNLLFDGKFYDPVSKNLQSFVDSQQENVSGTVTLLLKPNQMECVAVSSPKSHINTNIATYAQACSWTAADAEGFIKLFGMQSKIGASVNFEKNIKNG